MQQELRDFLLREFLNNSDDEIDQVFKDYGSNYTDLYDNIIERINRAPETMQSKQGISKINNIFDGYAGITIEDRGFQAPEGIRVFKSIGLVKANGTCEPHSTLTPKAKAPPPSSPEIMNRFPRGTDPSDTMGFISPTFPDRKELMNWPKAKSPVGFGKGSRGNKIPSNLQDVRVIGDGSVLAPAHVRSKSYKDAALAPGTGSSSSGQGRTLPQISLPGQAGPGPDGPIKITVLDIILNLNRFIDHNDDAWTAGLIDEASKCITAYLRHGSQDKRYNIHMANGYVRVAIFIQLPQMKRDRIDQSVIELVLMSSSPRIMTNANEDCIRAIQGHTLEQFDISELYEKISTLEDYVRHQKWTGRINAPDQLVLEMTNESHPNQWRRLETYLPSQYRRFHTMRAVCGTGSQEFGAKNVVSYAFLSVKSIFDNIPKIDIYIAEHGRIVTKCGLPSSVVTKVRLNDDMATEIINPMQAPPPSAPAGSQRVRSRDSKGGSKGGSPVPLGPNYTDRPVPDRTVVTKNSKLELRSGHHNIALSSDYGQLLGAASPAADVHGNV